MTDREAMLALAAPEPDDGLSPEWQAWRDAWNRAYWHAQHVQANPHPKEKHLCLL